MVKWGFFQFKPRSGNSYGYLGVTNTYRHFLLVWDVNTDWVGCWPIGVPARVVPGGHMWKNMGEWSFLHFLPWFAWIFHKNGQTWYYISFHGQNHRIMEKQINRRLNLRSGLSSGKASARNAIFYFLLGYYYCNSFWNIIFTPIFCSKSRFLS